MFSEYASKFLSKSRVTPAPLFNGAVQSIDDDSEDNYIGNESDFTASFASTVTNASYTFNADNNAYSSSDDDDPPSELLVERPPNTNFRDGDRQQAARNRSNTLHQNNNDSSDEDTINARRNNERQRNTSDGNGRRLRSPITRSQLYPRAKPPFIESLVSWCYILLTVFAIVTATLIAASGSLREGNIYPIFKYSAKNVALHAFIACSTSLIWLYLIRKYTRTVVKVSIYAVPPIMLSTVVYTLTHNVHKAVGYGSLVLVAVALLWTRYFQKVNEKIQRASNLIVYSANVINECSPIFHLLIAVSGIASLIVSAIWMVFIAHAFLEGKGGILLALFFTFMYIWTWGVLSASMQSVLTLVTSRWCLEQDMDGCLSLSVQETLLHSLPTSCYSSLISIMVRGPLLLLPKFVQNALKTSLNLYQPAVLEVLDPLCFPTAIVKRCSLKDAAEDVRKYVIDFQSYHLAKVILTATRLCCSLVTMFLSWVHADRYNDSSSLYSYWIGATSFIVGWIVSGTAETTFSTVADALLVCFCLGSYTTSDLEDLFTEPQTTPETTDYHDEP